MLGLLKSIFGPEAEARRLNKDAAYIVRALEEEHYGPLAIVGGIAKDLRDDIDRAFDTFIGRGPDTGKEYGHARAEDQLKRMHREARRRQDQRALTALTLALIYVRADRVGLPAAPARAAIDGFLDKWAPRGEVEAAAGTP